MIYSSNEFYQNLAIIIGGMFVIGFIVDVFILGFNSLLIIALGYLCVGAMSFLEYLSTFVKQYYKRFFMFFAHVFFFPYFVYKDQKEIKESC
jgi:hypothetical protein